jgi:hypothetical protein
LTFAAVSGNIIGNMEEGMSKIADRIQQHRGRLAAAGLRRMEVAVPAADAPLLRRLAALLRAGGQPAERLREQLAPAVGTSPSRSGEELVAFFRASPLVGEEIRVERDRSPGRAVDL